MANPTAASPGPWASAPAPYRPTCSTRTAPSTSPPAPRPWPGSGPWASCPPSTGPHAAFDRDRRRVTAGGDGLAHLKAEPGHRVVREQPFGNPLGRGLDEPEPAVLDDRGDGPRDRRVIERIGQVIMPRGGGDIGRHLRGEDE